MKRKIIEYQVVFLGEDGEPGDVWGKLTRKQALSYVGKEGVAEVRKVIWKCTFFDPDPRMQEWDREDETIWAKEEE